MYKINAAVPLKSDREIIFVRDTNHGDYERCLTSLHNENGPTDKFSTLCGHDHFD